MFSANGSLIYLSVCLSVFCRQVYAGRLRRLIDHLEDHHSARLQAKQTHNPEFDPFNQIERLRGGLEEEDDHAMADEEANELMDIVHRQHHRSVDRDSLQSPILDDTSNRHSNRSSLADPFRIHDDQSRISINTSVYGEASRRGSLDSNEAALLNDWNYNVASSHELIAAVSPTTGMPSQMGMDLTFDGSTMEVESMSLRDKDDDKRRAAQIQQSYTIESWRFRKFLGKLFEKEKQKHGNGSEPLLSFSSIVRPGGVSRLIAARTFYQVLVLASTGDIEVSQPDMNGDILISKVRRPDLLQ